MRILSYIGKRRHLSTGLQSIPNFSTSQQYVSDPIKIITIPVTTKKLFVYYKHKSELLNDRSLVVKYETKLVEKASNLWTKLQKSPKAYNKKVVAWVTSLLDKTPWTENSLNTIPSEGYILKRVKEKEEERTLTLKEYLKRPEQLTAKPVNIYYPKEFISEGLVKAELRQLWENGQKYHRKYALMSLAAIPFTLPLVLVPIVPNVPGFYLLYRVYRNFKANRGAKHLEALIESKAYNIKFLDLPDYSNLITSTMGNHNRVSLELPEQMVLTPKLLARLMDVLEIHEIAPDLEKAIRQESKRLLPPTTEKTLK